MSEQDSPFMIHILPRIAMTRGEFKKIAPRCSIALDGVVKGGPWFCSKTKRVNFDHHDGVVREATMSTAMQVYMAIKGGIMDFFQENGKLRIHIYINDTDQDTCLAVWYLLHYKLFEGVQSIPHMHRILALNDRMDVTGGAFPINLSERLLRERAWIFQPYMDLRKSGILARANEQILQDNLDAVLHRLDRYLMHDGEEIDLDTRHEILFDSPYFKIVNEIGGTEARCFLFTHGMNAYLSLVATRPDGRSVYTVGRRSQYIPFPVPKLFRDYNELEERKDVVIWDGSDIVGGSGREPCSGVPWEQLRDRTIWRLRKEKIWM
ncbi:MAG: hypothetical protein UU48_C0015G0021 [Candidatus Uhrbacteria bacterium GW2011_GWF2_41_16]|uniref:Uncharacterized protein n=2 Tax=Candidatus Uhriibacteriota TaxID=1752732 RepID=A0A0G0XKZ4_9BACT|nr:MAG: hypothetical protein UU35_C0016G0021 [Candidatus Uhrbacteria bacterium GW2011_GWC2_41_11]KKR97445.1 MAG: hypothetical protein UU48_C0015G0021 [Candidatus Uhrbacteria bacterium GW2011_GWF2_41_16]